MIGTAFRELRDGIARQDDSWKWVHMPSERAKELVAEFEQLRAVIQFARDKCVCRNAGGNTAFAYLWKGDWDEFERMADGANTPGRRPGGEE